MFKKYQSPNFPKICTKFFRHGTKMCEAKVLIGGIETCIKKTATITTASNEEEVGVQPVFQHDPSLGNIIRNYYKDHTLAPFFFGDFYDL